MQVCTHTCVFVCVCVFVCGFISVPVHLLCIRICECVCIQPSAVYLLACVLFMYTENTRIGDTFNLTVWWSEV